MVLTNISGGSHIVPIKGIQSFGTRLALSLIVRFQTHGMMMPHDHCLVETTHRERNEDLPRAQGMFFSKPRRF